MDSVLCDRHGRQQRTYVCQHLVKGLRERRRVGFFWTDDDPADPRPDAWCGACAERVRLTGGEWTGEAEEQLGLKVICGACYDVAKIFHMGGDPWS